MEGLPVLLLPYVAAVFRPARASPRANHLGHPPRTLTPRGKKAMLYRSDSYSRRREALTCPPNGSYVAAIFRWALLGYAKAEPTPLAAAPIEGRHP